jgi:uncharacterized protein YndB with AHSA1/START domain
MPDDRTSLTARVEQLIRKPASLVFAAFVEPTILTQFWLANASEPLAPGKTVRWDFKVNGASDRFQVTGFELNRRIEIRGSDLSTTKWTFTSLHPDETLVAIAQSGFPGNSDELVAHALDATQGYSIVLCDLKILLERGLQSNLVADKAVVIEHSRRRRQ